jgi:CCR4-NOT transcription complex subunit 1
MVPPPSRAGTFSPTPTQALQTGISHSPRPSQTGAISAASPSASSPTITDALTKIAVARVSGLLGAIKEDKADSTIVEQLRKVSSHPDRLTCLFFQSADHDGATQLIDDHGMEVFAKYFATLVAANASHIFSGHARSTGSAGNYHLLEAEMRKLSRDVDQSRRIAESIETGTDDVFRDFDISSFMEHFGLDALEKTILALAFKLGPRPDLKTKGKSCAICHGSRPLEESTDLGPSRCNSIHELPHLRYTARQAGR